MSLKDRIEAFEQDSKLLEEIAISYPQESEQYKALRRAAIALWYVLTERDTEFKEYFENFDRGLSASEKERLREMGIDPDIDSAGDSN